MSKELVMDVTMTFSVEVANTETASTEEVEKFCDLVSGFCHAGFEAIETKTETTEIRITAGPDVTINCGEKQ